MNLSKILMKSLRINFSCRFTHASFHFFWFQSKALLEIWTAAVLLYSSTFAVELVQDAPAYFDTWYIYRRWNDFSSLPIKIRERVVNGKWQKMKNRSKFSNDGASTKYRTGIDSSFCLSSKKFSISIRICHLTSILVVTNHPNRAWGVGD